MARDLSGKVIIITGASSGIGAATAIACARARMDVVLNARRLERLVAVADQVRRRGRAAEVVAGDVTDAEMPARLLDAAEARFGRFDVVYANAGYGLDKAMHELDEAALRQIFEVNFFAANRLVCEAARRLIAQRRHGHLLMCSSSVAKFTLPNFAAYTATKAAQNHVCRAMRMELRRYGIEVSSVHPITTQTEFFERAAETSDQPSTQAVPGAHVPRMFVQTAEQVARQTVRCLRNPTPEVWTSHVVRVLAGLATAWPGLLDIIVKARRPH